MENIEKLGLKKLRASSSKTTIHCNNCHCDRYSPCTCQVKKTTKNKEN
jgi:hypothetical protein